MKIAQWILVVTLVIRMLALFYQDINGRDAKEPTGFCGILSTLIATGLAVTVYYYAGALSEVLK